MDGCTWFPAEVIAAFVVAACLFLPLGVVLGAKFNQMDWLAYIKSGFRKNVRGRLILVLDCTGLDWNGVGRIKATHAYAMKHRLG